VPGLRSWWGIDRNIPPDERWTRSQTLRGQNTGPGAVNLTWTDISGQSETYPLVAYTYDSFGNQASAVTYSSAGVGRETQYTYDKMNRITKMSSIYYPSVCLMDD
jgi:hypothetical protein